jgi:hypothetical protein
MRTEREKKDLARLYQSLRIEVNHEMDALRDMLKGATALLRTGGRLSVITYHSLEDRIVKNVMKSGNVEGRVEQDFYGRVSSPFQTVGKLIVPDEDVDLTRGGVNGHRLNIQPLLSLLNREGIHNILKGLNFGLTVVRTNEEAIASNEVSRSSLNSHLTSNHF